MEYGKKTKNSATIKTIANPTKSNVHGDSVYHVVNNPFGQKEYPYCIAGIPAVGFIHIDDVVKA